MQEGRGEELSLHAGTPQPSPAEQGQPPTCTAAGHEHPSARTTTPVQGSPGARTWDRYGGRWDSPALGRAAACGGDGVPRWRTAFDIPSGWTGLQIPSTHPGCLVVVRQSMCGPDWRFASTTRTSRFRHRSSTPKQQQLIRQTSQKSCITDQSDLYKSCNPRNPLHVSVRTFGLETQILKDIELQSCAKICPLLKIKFRVVQRMTFFLAHLGSISRANILWIIVEIAVNVKLEHKNVISRQELWRVYEQSLEKNQQPKGGFRLFSDLDDFQVKADMSFSRF